MGGEQMSVVVDPAIAGNPNYDLNVTAGSNQVNLAPSQIPSHTHEAVVNSVITPEDHSHHMMTASTTGESDPPTTTAALRTGKTFGGNRSYTLVGGTSPATLGSTSEATLSVTTSVTNQPTGGSLSHDNFQPGIGAHYIIYIP